MTNSNLEKKLTDQPLAEQFTRPEAIAGTCSRSDKAVG